MVVVIVMAVVVIIVAMENCGSSVTRRIYMANLGILAGFELVKEEIFNRINSK